MEKTIFEKIIDREIPAKIEHEDDTCIVIHDIQPKAKLHLLIIPKKCIPTMNDIEQQDADIIMHLFLVAKKIADEKKIPGHKLHFNVNKAGGQEVPHIHLHFLANSHGI